MPKIERPSLTDPVENWLVYADALQTENDPLGELIILNQPGASTAGRDTHLATHAEHIFGTLAPHRSKLTIEWKHCVARTVSLTVGPKDDPVDVITALLASPLAASMCRLQIVARTPSDSDRVSLGAGLALLGERLSPSCTELELVDERAKKARILVSADYDPGQNLVDFGSLDAIWAIRHLASLEMYVADPDQIAFGTIDVPALERFGLFGLRWIGSYQDNEGPVSRALSSAEWPSLKRMALRLPETITYSWPEQYGAYVRLERYDEPSEDYEGDDGWNEGVNWSADLGHLLLCLARTPIEHLSLTSFSSSRSLLEALAARGLPPTLKHLDLSESNINDDDIDWMLEHRDLFARLETLDLRETLIRDASRLSGLGPQVQYESGSGAVYQFSVGME